MPETRYAPCGDLSLAYQVFGDGPVELVYAGSFVSHVELFWTMPECEAFMERLSRFCRIVMFDKAGVGLSDPVPKVRTLDDRAAEIEAGVELRGVPGTWQLLSVDHRGAHAGSREAQLVSTPTPGPRSGMRASDRALAVMARWTPWLLKGMGRLNQTGR